MKWGSYERVASRPKVVAAADALSASAVPARAQVPAHVRETRAGPRGATTETRVTSSVP